MRFTRLDGRSVFKNVSSHLIDWDADCRSKIQKFFKDFLYTYWFYDIVYEELPLIGTRLRVDLLNATRKIAVEVQGEQHENYIKHFHKSVMGYHNSYHRDVKKREWLEKNNYQILYLYKEDKKNISPEWILKNHKIKIR